MTIYVCCVYLKWSDGAVSCTERLVSEIALFVSWTGALNSAHAVSWVLDRFNVFIIIIIIIKSERHDNVIV